MKGNVTFAIGIKPKAKAGTIKPQYVSPSTQSLSILTDGANPVIVNLAPSSPDCSPNPAVPGAYVCSASLTVSAGNHIFTVTTFDWTNATGNVLSTNSTGIVVVKPTGLTTVSLVLEGMVQYVVLMLATTNPPIGTAATIGLTVSLEDADQNVIVGPAAYEYPVTLTTTDPINGPLSRTRVNSPADTSGIAANYTGAGVASITYSATATGLPAANVTSAVLAPGPPTTAEKLYVANVFGNSVSVFDVTHGYTPLPPITGGGLDYPYDVAVDASGKLYAANSDSNSVSIFDTARGNAVLPAITGGGLDKPTGVAIDAANGKLYVSNHSWVGRPWPFGVSVFDTAHGNVALPALTGYWLTYPWGVAVDASGKLYVANYAANSVSVFNTVHSGVLPAITGGLDFPHGVALDESGKLYIANYDSNSVSVFDTAHDNAALPTITGGGLASPQGVTVDSSGRLFVTNQQGGTGYGSISVFDTAHGNAALHFITGNGLFDPEGVATH